MSKEKAQPKPLTEAEYKALAEFRYQIRRFLRHMEEHAREFGHNPQQYQVLLAIEGLPKGVKPIISVLRRLASAARQELRTIGPAMAEALQALLQDLRMPKHGFEDGRQRVGKIRKTGQEPSEPRSKTS